MPLWARSLPVWSSILAPVARRRHMPFAAIGFASVVSMIPGVFLFRMASGLTQLASGSHTTLEPLSATIAEGMTAFNIILVRVLVSSFGKSPSIGCAAARRERGHVDVLFALPLVQLPMPAPSNATRGREG